ncbi:MAG: hypothetical protein GTN93_21560, partial [Anaerolineae bacterium]|nr:hypothetical protein [Anaerolineae bacterium]
RARQVCTYDFARPAKLSGTNLRALELIYSALARSWTETLSAMLRCKVTVRAGPLEQVPFGAYADSLPASALVIVLSMEPLCGEAFLDISPALALGVVERMAGGKGAMKSEVRPLTQIEHNVVRGLMNRLIANLAEAWSPAVPIRVAVSRSHTSADAVAADPAEAMLIASTTWQLGSHDERVNIAVPVNCLEPVLGALDPQGWLKTDATLGQTPPGLMARLLKSVGISASVQLGHAGIRVQEVLNMGVGDIVRLSTRVDEPVLVTVGGAVRFRGRPGLAGNRVSVQITGRVDDEAQVSNLTGAEQQNGGSEELVRNE